MVLFIVSEVDSGNTEVVATSMVTVTTNDLAQKPVLKFISMFGSSPERADSRARVFMKLGRNSISRNHMG